MGAGARALSSPSSHLEASMSPSRPPRCAALRLGAGARLFACLPVRRFDPVSGRHLLLVLSWDGTSPCVSQVAFCSCPFRPRLLSRSHFHFFLSFVSSGRRAHGTRTQATKKRVSVRVAPSSTGESLFSSFISSHASHLFTDSTLHQQINSVSIRRRLRRPSVSTDPGAQLQTTR